MFNKIQEEREIRIRVGASTTKRIFQHIYWYFKGLRSGGLLEKFLCFYVNLIEMSGAAVPLLFLLNIIINQGMG